MNQSCLIALCNGLYSVVFNGLVEFEHLRAMGTTAARDKTLKGNSIGNAIKVSYKFDKQEVHRQLLYRQTSRMNWLTGKTGWSLQTAGQYR